MNKERNRFFPLINRVNWVQFSLWSAVVAYLVFGPKLHYILFETDGKPYEINVTIPEHSKVIRYNIEDLKYWEGDIQVYEEGDTYALWGWAFPEIGIDTDLANYQRFFVIRNARREFLFSTKVYSRPGVKDVFSDRQIKNLQMAGLYSVISKNALPLGVYHVGILAICENSGESYYTESNKLLIRTPNHLILKDNNSNQVQ